MIISYGSFVFSDKTWNFHSTYYLDSENSDKKNRISDDLFNSKDPFGVLNLMKLPFQLF